MANNIPLYTASREHARAHDEIPLWRESINENIRCKQAIENAIRQSFDGMHLKRDCAESVIQEFGFDRVEYVLGNTLQQLKYDGRFLSYMSDKLLTEGNTVATLDELYIWLSNPTAIEYIRNCLKRVRKKESAMILASQNLDDFDQPNVREMTKPLFSIPPHQFLFNAGSIDKRSYMDMLQLEESEYDLIRYPQRGVCLYKCGNERYLLEVHAPPHKEALFGTAGGR